MHIPDARGIELGVWFMGMIGIVWSSIVSLRCTCLFQISQLAQVAGLPLAEKGRRLNFDLHRSGGVWVWLLLLILALTSISMNLPAQVMRPLVAKFLP